MQLELTDDETFALINLIVEAIEADKFPLSPRVQILRAILAKFGPMGPAPPPPARPPTPEERDPRRAPRYRPWRARVISTSRGQPSPAIETKHIAAGAGQNRRAGIFGRRWRACR
jgi:hypothetical protein